MLLCPKILPAQYETTFKDLSPGACFLADFRGIQGDPPVGEDDILLKIEPAPGMVPGAVRLRDGKFVSFLLISTVKVHRLDLQADIVGDLW